MTWMTTLERLLPDPMADCRALLEAAKQGPVCWGPHVQAWMDAEDTLNQQVAEVYHGYAVTNDPAAREGYQQLMQALTTYGVEVEQDTAWYKFWQAMSEDPEVRADPVKRAYVAHTLRDFRLAGVDRSPSEKTFLRTQQAAMTRLTQQFSDHVMDAELAWHHDVSDEATLAGVPEPLKALMAQAAETAGVAGWRLTLNAPMMVGVLQHAHDRSLRARCYEAWVTRASDLSPTGPEHDNGPVMAELLNTRHTLATALGFEDYAELTLQTRMASSKADVEGMFSALLERVLPRAREEWEAVQAYARTELGLSDLLPSDVGYVQQRMRETTVGFNAEALRPYFPLDQVLEGLREVVERLFGVVMNALEDPPRYHPDVRVFELTRRDGTPVGTCVMDLFARPHKRSGAWMSDQRVHAWKGPEGARTLQRPCMHVVANMAPPSQPDQPACLLHSDVETLFHEMGHALNGLLSTVPLAALSGLNGVPWDAVELPSQWLEQWCWQPEVLRTLSRHVETGESLPDTLIAKLQGNRSFLAGLGLVRQLELACFDWALHTQPGPWTAERIQATLDEVRDRVAVVPTSPINRFQHSFSHVFAGGYAAGYYSYLWAERLALDAFAAFDEEGLFNPELAQRFETHVLSQGGVVDVQAAYEAFRGRAPSWDGFLATYGLETSSAAG